MKLDNADVCFDHLEINGFQMSKNVIVSQQVVVKKNSLESLIQL